MTSLWQRYSSAASGVIKGARHCQFHYFLRTVVARNTPYRKATVETNGYEMFVKIYELSYLWDASLKKSESTERTEKQSIKAQVNKQNQIHCDTIHKSSEKRPWKKYHTFDSQLTMALMKVESTIEFLVSTFRENEYRYKIVISVRSFVNISCQAFFCLR